jgi:Zn-finger nucleic acid-binding protein
MAKFQTEGDWKCPKCGGVEFYKSRKEKVVTAARVTQYEDVRMCAKCDIPMESESVAKVQNSTSGCTSVLAALFFLSLAVWFIAAMFGL